MKKALIISDERKGHVNQSIAICHFLNLSYEIITVNFYSRFLRALTYPLDRVGIKWKGSFYHSPFAENDHYDLVICCGYRTYYPAKVIAAKLNLPSVAIMYPRGYKNSFQWVICPEHDLPPLNQNICTLPIAPHFYSTEQIETTSQLFKTAHPFEGEAVGFIIGGGCSQAPFDIEKLRNQLELIFEQKDDKEFWVTTSPRTSQEVETLLKKFPFDYTLFYSSSSFNPIPAFLTLCHRIFCTEDSVSMISACVCQGNAKIEVIESLKKRRKKIDLFISNLEKRGLLHRYNGTLGECNKKIEVKSKIQAFMQKALNPKSTINTNLS